ncbi:MAG: PQQ-binding-like beta-propeller repeat protein [Spirochaetaceae bacterium]
MIISNSDLNPSGCADFDNIRQSVKENPTTGKDASYRTLNLYMWLGALQQQGADLREFFDMDNEYYSLETLVNRGDLDSIKQMNTWVDNAYSMMEDIQTKLTKNGPLHTPYEANILPDEKNSTTTPGDRKNWPSFQGNISNTGSINAPGAQIGRNAWKFPASLGWYCRPLIEDNKIYVTSPGMRTTCFCLDGDSGEVLWKSGQTHPLFGIYKYPAMMSTPLSIGNQIVLKEVNSHGGNDGQARNLVFLDKESGKVNSKSFAGHIDYRTQYAPVATNGDYIVYPFGIHDIYSSPAVCQNLNRLVCTDAENREKKWDFNVGDMDILAEPVLNKTTVFQGTTDNYMYAMDLETGDMVWKFQAKAPINTQVVNEKGIVYFTANDGICYALNEKDGSLIWQIQLEEPTQNSRKQFSTLVIFNDSAYTGSSKSILYCLNLQDGNILWQSETPDWVRSRPVILKDRVIAACLDGTVISFDLQGRLLYKKKISTHPILADLSKYRDNILVTDGNLGLYKIDPQGNILWERTILESFNDNDGNKIFSDTLSGGTYYQSKPTAANGIVYFGTHAGLLYGVDSGTGQALWKFEMGGAISVGAAYYEGKLYVGQQGGERFFYCLDAKDGSLIWKKALPGGWVWGSACVDDGMVYIPTVDGHAVCMEANTGHIVWMYPTAKSVPSEPAIDGDLVYFGSWSQTLYAFHKKTGDIVWKQNGIRLDSGTLIAFQGKVYVPHHKNIFMAMDAKTGNIICSGNHNKQEKGNYSDFNATPCFRDNKAYFSARVGLGLHGVPLYTKLFCVDPDNADILWNYPDGGGISAPALSNNHLYIASGSMPYLHALDPETGEPKWIYKMGHRMEESTLCIYGNSLYALSSDGFVHAII